MSGGRNGSCGAGGCLVGVQSRRVQGEWLWLENCVPSSGCEVCGGLLGVCREVETGGVGGCLVGDALDDLRNWALNVLSSVPDDASDLVDKLLPVDDAARTGDILDQPDALSSR